MRQDGMLESPLHVTGPFILLADTKLSSRVFLRPLQARPSSRRRGRDAHKEC